MTRRKRRARRPTASSKRIRPRVTLVEPDASADEYVRRIRSYCQAVVANIIATGQELIKARTELAHGEFSRMIEDRLPFGRRTAQMLMAIARHPVLSNAKHISLLPPSWGTLYALAQLPDDVLKERIKDGSINPKIQRGEVQRLLPPPEPDPEPVNEATDEAPGNADGATDADDGAEASHDPNAGDFWPEEDEDERRLAALYAAAPQRVANIARVLSEFGGHRLPRNHPRLQPWFAALDDLRSLRTIDDVVQLITLLSCGEHSTLEAIVLSFLGGDPHTDLYSPSDPLSPQQAKRQAKFLARVESDLEDQWEELAPEERRGFGHKHSVGTWRQASPEVLEAFVDRHREELDPNNEAADV